MTGGPARDQHRRVHPIEAESYRVLRSRVDTGHLPPWTRAVVERVIHASADLGYAEDLVCDETHLERAAALLRDGVPVVTDAEMVSSGVTRLRACCFLRHPRTPEVAAASGGTRSAAAVHVGIDEVGPGAVWVVGNAPTALFALLERAADARPSLVVGLPVGFVGAVESKQALRESGLAGVTNHTEKGGSAVAAATVQERLYGSPI
jgi:precorrin-8X/cobalt-precorrin-8 methylmutase